MFSRFLASLAAVCALTGAAHAYTLTGSHWYSSTIPMQLELGTSAAPLADGSASWGAAAEDAFATWNAMIANTRFTVVRDSTAALAEGNRLNNVFFSNDVYGDAWGTGVLAITLTYTSGGSQSTECDVLFNKTLAWDSYRGALRYGSSGAVYDFHRVALHEFGHVLGLDHPDQAGQTVTAVMNSRISNLDTLAADDISGAQAIYGVSATAPAGTAPAITTQPVSQSVSAGSIVTFSVGVSNPAGVTYQWRKNGTSISGATAATYTLTGVTTAAGGSYAVVATNSSGSTTSNSAMLTVTTAVTLPAIITSPSSQTAAPGGSVTFSVTASGTAPVAYAWQKNGVAIPGATQPTYAIASVQAKDAGNYTVVVSNSAGSVTSVAAILTITAAPAFTTPPASQTVGLGNALSLSVAVTGTPIPTVQWLKDGSALPGATSTTYSIASAKLSDAGTYAVRASNSVGVTTSVGAVITIAAPPTISAAPAATTIAAGGQISLSVAASGTPAPTYQWQKNGSNLAGATQATLTIAAAAPTDAGTYSVVVTNSAGSVTSVPVLVTVNYSQLVNLSTRGLVNSGGALTAGFALRGSGDKAIIVRGVGPALDSFGVANALADPSLALIKQDTAQTLAINDSWSVVPQLSTDFQSVGAFPLPTGSADSASEVRLLPGTYSSRVTGDVAGASGVALVEVYDAESSNGRARLANLSTLGFSGTGENALVAGFSIQGNAPKRLLIRAIGPGLTSYGVAGVLADPRLDLYPLGQSTATAANDNWGGTAALKTAFTAASAFSLTDSSTDAALIVTLDPGGYSVVVTGVGGSTGNVLVELYDLDP